MRLGIAFLICSAVWAQTAATEIDISSTQAWTDTGVDLRPGDTVSISAQGTLQLPQAKSATPDGQARGFRDLLKAYPVNEAGLGALIGRVGSTDASQPFLVGSNKAIQVRRAGRLFLGVNNTGEALDGSFHAKIEFTTRGPEKAAEVDTSKLPKVTLEMIDRIPRRITDADGNAGDNTNFVIAGNEQAVLDTFKAAGWVQVDKDTKDAMLHGLLEVLNKQSYVEMPMSILTLYGRPQDYGLAHAEPIKVVAQRHHLRLWKAPFKVDGQELWIGAATHDIGFDKDNRPGKKITHKIDPDIDLEREYVARSLDETGLVAKLDYIIPGSPSKEARTATGGTFHSDGRMLVITLVASALK